MTGQIADRYADVWADWDEEDLNAEFEPWPWPWMVRALNVSTDAWEPPGPVLGSRRLRWYPNQWTLGQGPEWNDGAHVLAALRWLVREYLRSAVDREALEHTGAIYWNRPTGKNK